MNKIPKCKSKLIVHQPYIKVTKKESFDKNNSISNTNANINVEKISQKKLKFNDSNRHFGNDISIKVKNNVSPCATTHHIGKSLSNAREKVNYFFYHKFFFYRIIIL